MSKSSYSTEEIAKILSVSKLTVYDLIKKGELSAYRVGKQMRVDSTDLEIFKLRSRVNKGIETFASTSNDAAPSYQHQGNNIVICGQDMSLDILARHLESKELSSRALRSYEGSLNSLISMYSGESDIVSCHLFDGDTGEYNIPYIKRILTGRPFTVINLLSRQAGFYVQNGNPKQIINWNDLERSDIKMMNREKGSGARVLLDEKLRINNILPKDINGYNDEEKSHLSVAGAVNQETADVGIGIEKAAKIIGTDFIPLISERYDLVVLRSHKGNTLLKQLLTVLKSTSFQNELQSIGGYDISQTGEILYEN